MRLRVIGIGSPDGDDAIGLAVARRLRGRLLPRGVEVLERARPGLDLLDDLRGVDGAVLVDAICDADPAGAVRCVSAEQLSTRARASHAFGVGEALALARELERDLAPLRIVAISIGPAFTAAPGAPLSDAVRAAISPACARVCSELRALRRGG